MTAMTEINFDDAPVERVLHLLKVEELDVDLYRGPRNPGGKGRVFGGQVIGQALMAATGSVDHDRICHSLHAYFMRAGDENYPIIYRVERDYDGGSFSNRRVIAMQRGKPILNMTASFQKQESGFEHQADMPDVPGPDELLNEQQLAASLGDAVPERLRAFFTRPRPIEMRPVTPWTPVDPKPMPPVSHIWFRAAGPTGDDQILQRAILAYASDMSLLGTCMKPHGISWMKPGMQTASLDHAVWLHGEVKADEWMLYATDSDWSGAGRGFNRGKIFNRKGELIASTAQEGLIRFRADKAKG